MDWIVVLCNSGSNYLQVDKKSKNMVGKGYLIEDSSLKLHTNVYKINRLAF